jgi:hypothetical protein
MQQIKIFKGLESELPAVEKEVNDWLAETKAKVVQMFGNLSPQSVPLEQKTPGLHRGAYAPSDILIVVVYEAPVA